MLLKKFSVQITFLLELSILLAPDFRIELSAA